MHAILQTCIAVEERVEAIYRALAGHPEANEELRQIWQEMADDEARHAHRIRLVVDRLELAGVTALDLTADEVQALLDRAGELLQEAEEGTLSLEAAVYATVELEDAFMAAHLAYGQAGHQPDLQTMFRALAEEDRKHVAQLKSYLDRMNDGAGLQFDEPAP